MSEQEVRMVLARYHAGRITQAEAMRLLGIQEPQMRDDEVGLIEAGPRRCPSCRKTVVVLYDHKARWAFCPECKATIPPRDQTLTAKDREGLLAFKVYRYNRDGFSPKAHRTETEMLERE